MSLKVVQPENIKDVNVAFPSALRQFREEIICRYRSRFTELEFDITFTDGKRYVKVIENRRNGQSSVHSFVEKSTGDILKAASWAAPAKITRGNIFNRGGADAFAVDWQIRYL